MPDQQSNFIIKATNTASPEFKAAASDLKNLSTSVRAWGTGSADAKRSTSALLSELRAARAASNDAAGGFAGVGKAAQDAAKGGLREMVGQVPVVGGALAKLAGNMTGFAGAMGGVIGIGVGVISFLKSLSSEAGKALAETTKLSEGIGTKFAATIADVNKIAAQANQDRSAGIRLAYKAEIQAADAARKERLAGAKQELEENSGLWATFTGARIQAEKKYQAAVADIEADAANQRTTADAERMAALIDQSRQRLEIVKGLYDAQREAESAAAVATLNAEGKKTEALARGEEQRRGIIIQAYNERLEQIDREFSDAAEKDRLRVSAFQTMQSQLTQAEVEGSAARRQVIEQSVEAALTIYQKLGRGFEDISKKLSVVSFIEQSRRQIDGLRALGDAVRSGDADLQALGVTERDVASGIKELTDGIQTAITKGYVPVREAAQSATSAVTDSGNAARRAGADFQAMAANAASAAQAMAALSSARSAAARGNTGMRPGMTDAAARAAGERSLYDQERAASIGRTLQEAQDTINTYDRARSTAGTDRPSYATGGVIPGVGAVDITAHGDEVIGPPKTIVAALSEALRSASGPRTVVNFGPGSINQSGTVISQERDWQSLVDTLADSIAARRT